MNEARVTLAVPAAAQSHVAYAAAFIDPAIASVRLEGDTWRFALSAPVAAGVLEAGLNTLAERFKAASAFEPAPIFSLPPRADAPGAAAVSALAGAAIQEIHPGLFVYRPPISTLVRFLDHAIVARFARPFGAVEESYPNCIPLDGLGRAQHLSSFPEHLHFLTHLRQDLGVLDGFAATARAQGTPLFPARAPGQHHCGCRVPVRRERVQGHDDPGDRQDRRDQRGLAVQVLPYQAGPLCRDSGGAGPDSPVARGGG